MSKLRTLASATKRRLVSPPVDDLRREVETMRRLNERLERTVDKAQGTTQGTTQGKVKPAPKAGALPADYDDEAKQIITTVRPYTMTSNEKLYALVTAVRYVVDAGIEGDLVECGVWRGGSMHAVARTLLAKGVTDRDLHLFDTFSGMTEPTERDVSLHVGKSASELLETSDRTSHTWAVASREDVEEGLATLDYPQERFHLVEGPVEETIPGGAPQRIALLRLDTDWYESTRHELEHLYPRLSPGGVLIIDDYGHWQGARRAVDEFLATVEPVLLQRIDYTGRLALKPG
jgi:O-methyltransferase